MVHIDPEIKEEIIHKNMVLGRTIKSLSEEYGYSTYVLRNMLKKYREECQKNHIEDQNLKLMEENKRLLKEREELEKEIDFLKKAAAFFAKNG